MFNTHIRECNIIYISIAPFAGSFVIRFGFFFFEAEASYLILYVFFCHFTVVHQHPVVVIDFFSFH